MNPVVVLPTAVAAFVIDTPEKVSKVLPLEAPWFWATVVLALINFGLVVAVKVEASRVAEFPVTVVLPLLKVHPTAVLVPLSSSKLKVVVVLKSPNPVFSFVIVISFVVAFPEVSNATATAGLSTFTNPRFKSIVVICVPAVALVGL